MSLYFLYSPAAPAESTRTQATKSARVQPSQVLAGPKPAKRSREHTTDSHQAG